MVACVNGDTYSILDLGRDLSFLIEKYMGDDSKLLFDSFLLEKETELESLRLYVEELRDELAILYKKYD